MISTPYEALSVDPVCRYTLKGVDGSEKDFMGGLPLVSQLTTIMVSANDKVSEELIFDKSSNQINQLVDKTWLCRYLICRYDYMIPDRSSNEI